MVGLLLLLWNFTIGLLCSSCKKLLRGWIVEMCICYCGRRAARATELQDGYYIAIFDEVKYVEK